jgi:hypothetical protein
MDEASILQVTEDLKLSSSSSEEETAEKTSTTRPSATKVIEQPVQSKVIVPSKPKHKSSTDLSNL